MGINKFLADKLNNPPIVSEQDKVLNAVTNEISNKGFVIGQADKLFN